MLFRSHGADHSEPSGLRLDHGQHEVMWNRELDCTGGLRPARRETAATEVRLLDGHKGTKTIATIAVELGSAESAMLRAARASNEMRGSYGEMIESVSH